MKRMSPRRSAEGALARRRDPDEEDRGQRREAQCAVGERLEAVAEHVLRDGEVERPDQDREPAASGQRSRVVALARHYPLGSSRCLSRPKRRSTRSSGRRLRSSPTSCARGSRSSSTTCPRAIRCGSYGEEQMELPRPARACLLEGRGRRPRHARRAGLGRAAELGAGRRAAAAAMSFDGRLGPRDRRHAGYRQGDRAPLRRARRHAGRARLPAQRQRGRGGSRGDAAAGAETGARARQRLVRAGRARRSRRSGRSRRSSTTPRPASSGRRSRWRRSTGTGRSTRTPGRCSRSRGGRAADAGRRRRSSRSRASARSACSRTTCSSAPRRRRSSRSCATSPSSSRRAGSASTRSRAASSTPRRSTHFPNKDEMLRDGRRANAGGPAGRARDIADAVILLCSTGRRDGARPDAGRRRRVLAARAKPWSRPTTTGEHGTRSTGGAPTQWPVSSGCRRRSASGARRPEGQARAPPAVRDRRVDGRARGARRARHRRRHLGGGTRRSRASAGPTCVFVEADVQQLPLQLSAAASTSSTPAEGVFALAARPRRLGRRDRRRAASRAATAARLRRPSGLRTASTSGSHWREDYFDESPIIEVGWSHFELPGEPAKEEKYERFWRLGQIVTALARAGLTIGSLEEYSTIYETYWREKDRASRPVRALRGARLTEARERLVELGVGDRERRRRLDKASRQGRPGRRAHRVERLVSVPLAGAQQAASVPTVPLEALAGFLDAVEQLAAPRRARRERPRTRAGCRRACACRRPRRRAARPPRARRGRRARPRAAGRRRAPCRCTSTSATSAPGHSSPDAAEPCIDRVDNE